VGNLHVRITSARLAHRISEVIEAQKLSQVEAAGKLGIDQPKVWALARGRLKDYSTERLMRFVTALEEDVIITIRKSPLAADGPPRSGGLTEGVTMMWFYFAFGR
jgi:predicted XRE-type DNA-binding protein